MTEDERRANRKAGRGVLRRICASRLAAAISQGQHNPVVDTEPSYEAEVGDIFAVLRFTYGGVRYECSLSEQQLEG